MALNSNAPDVLQQPNVELDATPPSLSDLDHTSSESSSTFSDRPAKGAGRHT